MIQIERCILSHLIKMTEEELARQIAIQSALGEYDEAPPDFDANDIPIYETILKELHAVESNPERAVDLGRKPSKIWHFLLMIIPDYAERNLKTMTQEELRALQSLYAHDRRQSRKFPDWK